MGLVSILIHTYSGCVHTSDDAEFVVGSLSALISPVSVSLCSSDSPRVPSEVMIDVDVYIERDAVGSVVGSDDNGDTVGFADIEGPNDGSLVGKVVGIFVGSLAGSDVGSVDG